MTINIVLYKVPWLHKCTSYSHPAFKAKNMPINVSSHTNHSALSYLINLKNNIEFINTYLSPSG